MLYVIFNSVLDCIILVVWFLLFGSNRDTLIQYERRYMKRRNCLSLFLSPTGSPSSLDGEARGGDIKDKKGQ